MESFFLKVSSNEVGFTITVWINVGEQKVNANECKDDFKSFSIQRLRVIFILCTDQGFTLYIIITRSGSRILDRESNQILGSQSEQKQKNRKSVGITG